jgi:hypothetical protein
LAKQRVLANEDLPSNGAHLRMFGSFDGVPCRGALLATVCGIAGIVNQSPFQGRPFIADPESEHADRSRGWRPLPF